LGFLALACGDSEKKKSDPSDKGGAGGAQATGGSTAAGAGGAAARAGAGGGAGTASGNAGSSGSGVAGGGRGGTGGSSGEGGAGDGGADDGGVGGDAGDGPIEKATKLDVLFVIDNSISMAEKQTVLADAVPTLVGRLVDPYCVRSDSSTVPPTNGVCPANTTREISPVRDMHVGVITTSLGSHGGDVCVPDPNDTTVRTLNDQAHLIGTVRTGLSSWNDSGFLNWDPDRQATPVGETSATAFTSALQAMIAAAGDHGCGYEAPLEAMYRFLVDPDPPETVTNDGTVSVLNGVDSDVLDQRRAFLRPDSAVLVIALSDEDDCSILDEPNHQGWLVGRRVQMPRGSAACAGDPNDPCCRPCVSPAQPGCPTDAEDTECQKGATLPTAEDSTNLRCYRQRERFGIDFLYPLDRYLTGLTETRVRNHAGELVDNPLFAGGRSPDLVVLTTIVGVPWQDLVIETEDFDGYELMTARQLRDYGRFRVILGDYAGGVPPTDPFMTDSVDPRSGSNPITLAPIVASTTAAPTATINGHEQNIISRDDLQYACTFELPTPIPCTDANQDDCDCNVSEAAYARPVCQDPMTNLATNTQYYGKAYPGRRELEVARRMRDRAVLASICPRTLEDEQHPSYGYIPVMRAIQRQVTRVLAP
jgi:hypothetical protein